MMLWIIQYETLTPEGNRRFELGTIEANTREQAEQRAAEVGSRVLGLYGDVPGVTRAQD